MTETRINPRPVLNAIAPANCADVPPLHTGPGTPPRAVCCRHHWWQPVVGEKAS